MILSKRCETATKAQIEKGHATGLQEQATFLTTQLLRHANSFVIGTAVIKTTNKNNRPNLRLPKRQR
jgi:hypothetical protein